MGRLIIITDFELIKEAFNKKELSDRFYPQSWTWYRDTAIKETSFWRAYFEADGPSVMVVFNAKTFFEIFEILVKISREKTLSRNTVFGSELQKSLDRKAF